MKQPLLSRRALLALPLLMSGRTQAGTPGQRSFRDDAGRVVSLPREVRGVFAAGAPAELMLYTLAPDKLVGRNHLPSKEALDFMPPAFHQPRQIERLPDARDARNDAELLALAPDVYIDYGDMNKDYIDSVAAIQNRTHIPSIILDGRLRKIPATYRRLGAALGVASRGNLLADEAGRILKRYARMSRSSGQPSRMYVSCSGDATSPCVGGTLSGEAVDLLGAVNVAGTDATALRRPVTSQDLLAWQPDVIIVGSAQGMRGLMADPSLQSLPAIAQRRVYVPPSVPFSWSMRPPSVNRLLGAIWLAAVAAGEPVRDSYREDMKRFFRIFYQVELDDVRLARLLEASRPA